MVDTVEPKRLQTPTRRPLRVFAFDPSRGRLLGNEMRIDVRYRSLGPGPMDRSDAQDDIAVIDYDVSRKKYYRPVNLDDPYVLIPNGIPPSEEDPRFHQQMLYAVASDTIEHFESALGRRIHWRRAERKRNAPKGWLPDDILTLSLYPHAMQEANAFYSPEAHGILFGYFKARGDDASHTIPGQTVFTCLSHDIIVHEVTHAILDGLRGHFLEQTNPDVAAFHEAFADLAALFRHFSHREVLMDAIQRTGGRLYMPGLKVDALADQAALSWLAKGDSDRNPLIELAGQFGEAMGMRTGLRSAIGRPKSMRELGDTAECHERGAILVAAVFDAFFTIYLQRAAKHFRIYRAAGGADRDDLPVPLADALFHEASSTASEFFRTCARALDYLPPVDITFGDFLRAVMTSERDFDPLDSEGVCDAWMQAFRRRGILPDDALFFSEEALCWHVCPELEVENLPFGGPFGLTYAERQDTVRALNAFIGKHKDVLDLDPRLEFNIPSFHPLFRINKTGSIRWDLVVEVVQTARDERSGFPLRGGTTMIVSSDSTSGANVKLAAILRYSISKPISGALGTARRNKQAAFLAGQGFKRGINLADLRTNFALIHGGA